MDSLWKWFILIDNILKRLGDCVGLNIRQRCVRDNYDEALDKMKKKKTPKSQNNMCIIFCHTYLIPWETNGFGVRILVYKYRFSKKQKKQTNDFYALRKMVDSWFSSGRWFHYENYLLQLTIINRVRAIVSGRILVKRLYAIIATTRSAKWRKPKKTFQKSEKYFIVVGFFFLSNVYNFPTADERVQCAMISG